MPPKNISADIHGLDKRITTIEANQKWIMQEISEIKELLKTKLTHLDTQVTALEADAHTLKTKLWLAWVIVTAAASAFGAVVSRKLGL
jgi:flagellar capping protein FliD